jgi:hypothetical protein
MCIKAPEGKIFGIVFILFVLLSSCIVQLECPPFLLEVLQIMSESSAALLDKWFCMECDNDIAGTIVLFSLQIFNSDCIVVL